MRCLSVNHIMMLEWWKVANNIVRKASAGTTCSLHHHQFQMLYELSHLIPDCKSLAILVMFMCYCSNACLTTDLPFPKWNGYATYYMWPSTQCNTHYCLPPLIVININGLPLWSENSAPKSIMHINVLVWCGNQPCVKILMYTHQPKTPVHSHLYFSREQCYTEKNQSPCSRYSKSQTVTLLLSSFGSNFFKAMNITSPTHYLQHTFNIATPP